MLTHRGGKKNIFKVYIAKLTFDKMIITNNEKLLLEHL